MSISFLHITSSSNRIIKETRELHDKKGRLKHSSFILEGSKLVEEAITGKVQIRYVLLAESFEASCLGLLEEIEELTVYKISDELFNRVSSTETPQGIMAVACIPKYEIDLKGLSRCVILENVQDPGNLGTIIRAADACGFDGVILSKGCADPYNSKVLRSTMGSIFHLPVCFSEHIFETVKVLKETGIRVAAAHTKDSDVIWETSLADRIAIVIGNEGNGISDRMLEAVDLRIMIPMPGKAESLNASVAAAIIMYESMRQKLVNG